MNKLIILVLLCISFLMGNAQNYIENGDFEYGLNANWTHIVASGGKADFCLSQDQYVMEGSVGLKISVDESTANQKAIKSTTQFIASSDSIYLLRFWARGLERSKMYVEVEGSETPGVLYEMHSGRTLFHLPFETTQKDLKINFYFEDDDVTYHLDGVEVLDQNNTEGIDVLNTYNWQHNRQGEGWTAGDNDISILLPDGRTVWFFNDSFYGTNDIANNPLYEVGSFIRNAMVIQELDGTLNTRSFVDQNGQKAYFEVPDPIFGDDGKQKNFFWVGDAIIEDEEIKLHLIEVKEVTGGAEATGDSYLAKFSYPELEYLGLEKQAGFCHGYETFFIDNDSIYLYKSEGVGIWDRYSHVARTKLGNLAGNEPWEYWDGENWGDNADESARINDMGADGFMKLAEGNYAHVSMPNLGNQVQVSFAPNPEGPWTVKETVYTIPNDSAYWFYMPNFHSQLPNGNYSISYSVNSWYKLFFAFEAFVDKFWYRQRYIQVDLLGLSPYSTKTDCAGVVNGEAYLDECDHCVGGATGAEPCVTGIAKLYSDCDYTGSVVGLSVGDYSLDDLQILDFTNNDLSSLEVEDGYVVELFEEDQFEGDHLLIASSSNCLENEAFNNKATSLIVRRDKISELSRVYAVQNKQSELFMSVTDKSTENYAIIEQAGYEGDSQAFEFEDIGDGYYKITNVASGLALNVVDASDAPKANIEQWDGLEFDLTDFGGLVSAQYDDSPTTEKVVNVTDNNVNTKFLTFHNRAWIQFQSTISHVVTGYSITSANDAEMRDPKNWSLRASNDGENWVLLDTLSNVDFSSRFEEKFVSIENSTVYIYYRLDMECNSDDILQLAEWKLHVSPETGEELSSQVFFVQDAGDGYFRIINKNSDLLLEIIDGDKTEGTRVRQMNDIGQAGALWKLVDPNDIPTDVFTIESQQTETDMIVYPNPVNDELKLKLNGEWFASDLSIMNLYGVTVWNGRFENKPMQVGNLMPGFYFIQLTKGNCTKVGSFIKR